MRLHISAIFRPDWADLSIICSRHGWFNDAWHCSGGSKRPERNALNYFCLSWNLSMQITTQVKNFSPAWGYLESNTNYWYVLEKCDSPNWIRKRFFLCCDTITYHHFQIDHIIVRPLDMTINLWIRRALTVRYNYVRDIVRDPVF